MAVLENGACSACGCTEMYVDDPSGIDPMHHVFCQGCGSPIVLPQGTKLEITREE